LPTSNNKACTASSVYLEYFANKLKYTIHFIDYTAFIQKAESMAQRDSDNIEKANVARQKLKSLFLSLDLSPKQSIQSIREAIRDLQDPIVDHILKRPKTFTFQDAQTLQESIKPFVRNNSSDAAGSINFRVVIDHIRSVRD